MGKYMDNFLRLTVNFIIWPKNSLKSEVNCDIRFYISTTDIYAVFLVQSRVEKVRLNTPRLIAFWCDCLYIW